MALSWAAVWLLHRLPCIRGVHFVKASQQTTPHNHSHCTSVYKVTTLLRLHLFYFILHRPRGEKKFKLTKHHPEFISQTKTVLIPVSVNYKKKGRMNVQSETCNFKSLLGQLLSSCQVSGEELGDNLLTFLNIFSPYHSGLMITAPLFQVEFLKACTEGAST